MAEGIAVSKYGTDMCGTYANRPMKAPLGMTYFATDTVQFLVKTGASTWEDVTAVTTAEIADEAVTVGKMADLARGSILSGQTASNRPAALAAETSGQILVGNGTDLVSVAVSGDATLAANGAVTIATGAVEDSMIEGLTASQFIIGVDGTAANNAKVVMSGAGTLSTAGALTLTNPPAYDTGRAAIATLRVAADVISAETVTIGADVYEVEIVNTDSTDNTAGGNFNNVTDPLTVTGYTTTYPNCPATVGRLIRIENEILRITVVAGANVTLARGASGTTVAAHADAVDIYEGDGIAGGSTIAVGLVLTLTPAAFTDALIDDLNTVGTELLAAVDISANEVLVHTAATVGGAAAASAATTALAEGLTGVNNAWDTAALRGGRVAGIRKTVTQVRLANAQEEALGTMHFVFPFTPTVLDVSVFTGALSGAGGGVRIAWNGAVTVSGGRVTLDNAGTVDWAANSLMSLTVSD